MSAVAMTRDTVSTALAASFVGVYVLYVVVVLRGRQWLEPLMAAAPRQCPASLQEI
jgi:hypothetical protein